METCSPQTKISLLVYTIPKQQHNSQRVQSSDMASTLFLSVNLSETMNPITLWAQSVLSAQSEHWGNPKAEEINVKKKTRFPVHQYIHLDVRRICMTAGVCRPAFKISEIQGMQAGKQKFGGHATSFQGL